MAPRTARPIRRKTRRPIAKKKKRPVKLPKLRSAQRSHRLRGLPTVIAEVPMTAAMVDRLMWRAGFGPSDADRKAFVGMTVGAAVDKLLATPQGPLQGTEPKNGTNTLDIKARTGDLVLTWLDRMVRTPTPVVERMTLFWHGHWTSSRDDVQPTQLMQTQNDRLRKYADFAANPTADVRAMANEMATDPAMLRYLTGESNVKGKANENYGREVMELFLLGVVGPDGQPNYSEADVKEIARAYSGWRLDEDDPDNIASYFTPSRWDGGQKTVLGKTGPFNQNDANAVVLQHPNHAAFMVRSLWDNFIPTAPQPNTLADLAKTYLDNGLQVKPVLKKILTNSQLYESIDEPNMIKSPTVYVVGVMRGLKVPITDERVSNFLGQMGQLPFYPPTVAGWEGGPSWLNTNTVLGRYGFVQELVGKMTDYADNPTETPQAAFDRAYAAVANPWLSAGSRAALIDYATNRAPAKTVAQRKNRQVVLRTLMLAGPDSQVM